MEAEESAKTLSCMLREKTAKEHAKTEASPIMSQMMGDNFSIDEYAEILKRFLIFYQAIEESIKNFLIDNPIYQYRYKSPLLISDLKSLNRNLTKKDHHHVNLDIKDIEDFIGVLYVLEGSTLGGSLIRKTLVKHFGEEGSINFFYPYGKEVKKYWDKTKAFIDEYGDNPKIDKEAVYNAAISTFICIRKALNEQSVN